MILIPAIDLLDGKCVRLLQGDYDKVTEYGADPVGMAKAWQRGGGKRLHVVDLDGAKAGRPRNEALVMEIAEELSIPVEVGGGIRSFEQVDRYLSSGVDRVILGTAAFKDPKLLAEAAAAYPGRVWVGIDARDGKVAIQGWTENTATDAYELAVLCQEKGAGGVIFTDIARDGMLTGPNLESLETLADRTEIPIIASGGISSLEDLRALRDSAIPRIEGVITGKALYAGAFTIEE
jgi:phosphoribosylformimino-5-aminoimidazole carboxamide ribotide isomerase